MAQEVRSVDGVAVTNEAFRKTMNPNHLAKEQGRHVTSRHRFCGRNEDSHLRETVHDDKNNVMVVAREEDMLSSPRKHWTRAW